MEKTNIKTKDKSYNVIIGSNLTAELLSYIKAVHQGKKIAIITDSIVSKLFKKEFAPLEQLNPLWIEIEPGEKSKTRKTKEEIEDRLLENKFGRDSAILALGGGVVGDLSGFVASTFNRGIPIIHIPTTLLAMADSSIGGKTGINTKHGKNLIGTIHHPDAVFCDTTFIEKLPEEEFKSGLAEIIKIAIALDRELFNFLESNHEKILSKENNTLIKIINRSVELKKEIVEKDPNESGLRQVLNFGHTIGHAVEACSNFTIKHGFCVSIGIALESEISGSMGILEKSEVKKIKSVLDLFSLPTKIDGIDHDRLLEVMAHDKKNIGNKPKFVLLEAIGKTKSENRKFSFEVDEEIIKSALMKNDRNNSN